MTPEERRAKDRKDADAARVRRDTVPAARASSRDRWRRAGTKYGNQPRGKDARADYMREWRAGNVDRAREISRTANLEYLKRDPERYRIQCAVRQANRRARKLDRAGHLTYAIWLARLELFGNACAFCGASGCHLDLEHLEPLASGGTNEPSNVAPACRPCNAQKWRRPLAEFCALRGIDLAALLARASSCA
jgi:5-methylcytosine-specific restriction endonuclease McrA